MKNYFEQFLELAIQEDFFPCGDVTTNAIVDETKQTKLLVKSRRQSGIFSGAEFANKVYKLLDQSIVIEEHIKQGDAFAPNEKLITLSGNANSILQGERLFLNLLQRATSIATYTNQFVELVKGTKTKILDTRKTTPGLRELEKKAVVDGGGFNHRFNLSTGLMIKDNHIALAGSIEEAIKRAKEKQPYLTKIEVEVDSIEQLKKVIGFNIDIVLLDNFNLEAIAQAKQIIGNKAKIEVSGGISLNTVRQIAEIGVDYISSGSLTQSPSYVDLGLDFE